MKPRSGARYRGCMRRQGEPAVVGMCAGGWRLARAVTVSLAALALAVGGHLVVGGTLPSPATLAGVWVLSATLSWALSGHRWSGRELAGVLTLVQAVVHMTCAMVPDHAISDVGPTMLAGHLAATVLCVYLLSRAEAALWHFAETYLPRPLTAIKATSGSGTVPGSAAALPWVEAWSSMARLLVVEAPLRAPPQHT